MTLRVAILGGVLVASGPPAFAHQVDKYLQATYFSLTKDSLKVEMFLTPGVAVLPAVLAALDSNGDGMISEAEQRAYAGQVVRDLAVKVNGENLRPQLLATDFPSLQDMKEGLGTIHLELKLDLPRNPSRWRLSWENRHKSQISAYQVNCLMPADPALRIVSEHRNFSQSMYELEYSDGRASAAISGTAEPGSFRMAIIALMALLP